MEKEDCSGVEVLHLFFLWIIRCQLCLFRTVNKQYDTCSCREREGWRKRNRERGKERERLLYDHRCSVFLSFFLPYCLSIPFFFQWRYRLYEVIVSHKFDVLLTMVIVPSFGKVMQEDPFTILLCLVCIMNTNISVYADECVCQLLLLPRFVKFAFSS